MEHFLINSSVCLFSLWLVYKLLLENTSWHVFKRAFLLSSLLVSLTIPFIVVRTVTIPFNRATSLDPQQFLMAESPAAASTFEIDWVAILLSIYLIGVLLMGYRFFKNLYHLQIKPTDELTSYESYVLVLRKLVDVPHSFFNRIYASRNSYKKGAIPDAVLLHEKAHLDQNHTYDILLIELLIVVLWFNPLLYLIKYSIKLNHEFLADQAVLTTGTDAKAYQNTLLAYTTGSTQRALINTFNFPLIKKRFTIMKTHTTTASMLLRSFAIIPILALLVVSCGQEEIVIEPEVIEIVDTVKVQGKTDHPEIIEVIEDQGEKKYELSANKPQGYISMNGKSYSYIIKSNEVYVFTLNGQPVDYQKLGYSIDVNSEPEIIEVIEVLENLSPEDIDDYNRLAKKHAAIIEEKGYAVYFKNETQRMQTIWNTMSQEQRANAEPWPYIGFDGNKAGEIAPPPPPQPWFTHTPTLIKGMQDGSIKLLLNGKTATIAQAKRLPEFWNKNDFQFKSENGITTVEYSGKLN